MSAVVTGSDRVVAVLRERGGLALKDEVLAAVGQILGHRAAEPAIRIAVIGGRVRNVLLDDRPGLALPITPDVREQRAMYVYRQITDGRVEQLADIARLPGLVGWMPEILATAIGDLERKGALSEADGHLSINPWERS